MLIEHDYIEVIECDNLPKRLSGLWLGDMILINRNLPITSKHLQRNLLITNLHTGI